MPVHMGDHVSKTGEIDFLRRQQLALNLFYRENNPHQIVAFTVGQVCHLANVALQYHPAKSRMIVIVYIHDARERI